MTGAASGLADFDHLMKDVATRAPVSEPVTIEEIGFATAALSGERAKRITGSVIYIDGGYNIIV